MRWRRPSLGEKKAVVIDKIIEAVGIRKFNMYRNTMAYLADEEAGRRGKII